MYSLLDQAKGIQYNPSDPRGLLGLAGGVPGASSGAAPAAPSGGFGSKLKAFGQNPMAMMALAKGIGGMSHNKNQGLQDGLTMMMQGEMAKRQKEQELEILSKQANKTADYIEAAGDKTTADMIRSNPQDAAKIAAAWNAQRTKPKETFKQITGADGTLYNVSDLTGKQTAVGGGNTTINNQMPQNYPKPPSGYHYVPQPDGGMTLEVTPGGPVEAAANETEQKAGKLKKQQSIAANTVVQDIDRMLTLTPRLFEGDSPIGKIAAGIGSTIAEKIPQSVTNEAAGFRDSILSNIGIDQLMQMKFNSPTGGALGQVPFQQQQRLEQLLGAIDLTQDPDIVENNLKRIRNIYLDTIHGSKAERDAQLGQVNPATGKVITQDDLDEIDALYTIPDFSKESRDIQVGDPKPREAGIPTITTQAEFDALPKGAIYEQADGQRFRK